MGDSYNPNPPHVSSSISGVRMPLADGVQLANRLPARRYRIPVLLIGAHSNGADVPDAKPFDIADLLALIRRLLNSG